VLDSIARTAGGALADVFGAVARVRPPLKPLHPRGHTTRGSLERHGLVPPVGAAWLDEPGTDSVVVRRSKAVGTPARLPDIYGLAIRAPLPDGRFGDLLLATTGTWPVARHLLRPTTSPDAPVTTLLPYRTASGPVLIGAFATQDHTTMELRVATLTGPWRTFATLHLLDDATHADDSGLRFDPVLNPLPGLAPYRWVNLLREPAYYAARRNSPQ
jgi:hypothetical protein